jgi:hypothetical protein
MVPRRRLNEVEAERRRLASELEARETALREAQQRDENAVQRATRERDEARAAQQAAQAELRTERHGSIFQRAALSSATPIRADALEAALRLVNLDVCDTPEHAADAVTDLVTRYPFLASSAEPTPPPRIGQPVGGASGGQGAPNGGQGQPPATMEETRLSLGRWLAGNVMKGGAPSGAPPQ